MHIARPTISPSPRAISAETLSILYVLGEFPVLSETFISNEIRAMRRLGHRIVPLALRPATGACQPEDEAFRDETLALAGIPRLEALRAAFGRPGRFQYALQFAMEQTGIRPRSLMLAGARAALAARSHGCTHLHAHFAGPAAATAIVGARLAGLTCSFTAHGYDVYGTPSDLVAKLQAADVAMAVCEDMRRDFHAMSPATPVALVRCGVDPTRFRPRIDGVRNGRLLAVGRLVHQKGYDVLLAALAALPPAERPVIDAVGGGELEAGLKAQALALGVAGSINFLGPRPAGWISVEGPSYLGFVAPYCLAPNGDRDTGAVVAREAMMMGLPVVASRLMGLPEAVRADCGRLVPPRDVPALAEALRWVATLPEPERRRLGAAGRRRAEREFTIDGQAASTAAAIAVVRS